MTFFNMKFAILQVKSANLTAQNLIFVRHLFLIVVLVKKEKFRTKYVHVKNFQQLLVSRPFLIKAV